MKRLLALAALCVLPLLAQTDRYTIHGALAVTSSGTTITVVPIAGATPKRADVESISFQPIGAAITVAQERDCTSVTTTSPVAAKAINSDSGLPLTTANVIGYTGSAATGCTDIGPPWKIAPDNGVPFTPGTGFTKESGTNKNLNFRIAAPSSITLNYQIILKVQR